jgi:hypothetical protein
MGGGGSKEAVEDKGAEAKEAKVEEEEEEPMTLDQYALAARGRTRWR